MLGGPATTLQGPLCRGPRICFRTRRQPAILQGEDVFASRNQPAILQGAICTALRSVGLKLQPGTGCAVVVQVLTL